VLYSAEVVLRPPFPYGAELPGLDCVYDVPGRASECKVQPGWVFVMGDNRDNSSDSRAWGGVPINYVKGRAMFVWWSRGQHSGIRWNRMGKPIE
jgi:signal peptidase I